MPEIANFDGISLGNPLVAPLVDASLNVAELARVTVRGVGVVQLQAGISRLALVAAMTATTAMLAMASAACTLDTDPADIGVAVDDAGNLILRCEHSPPHEWDYATGRLRS